MELKVGKITNKELAEWFGVKPNTLSKKKVEKLEELKEYAEYHLEKGKVFIDKVYKPVYIKKKSANYRAIRNTVDETWSRDGLDSCRRVSEEVYELVEDKITPATVYAYTREARNELYGKPFSNGGLLGRCVYLWCKKNEDGKLEKFSLEEEKIKQDLKIKYFGDVSEKQMFVKEMVRRGEITEEQAWGVLEDLTGMDDVGFVGFLRELQEKIGAQVVRGTFVERDGIKYLEAEKKGLLKI